MGTAEIAVRLEIKVTNARVLAWRIRNAETASTRRYNAYHKDRVMRPPQV
jgi:hypothetical protein